MTKATHTPGAFSFDGIGINDLTNEYHRRVATLTTDYQTEEIGNLLAAAPEMLEALEEARLEISRLNRAAGETRFNPTATQMADAAIAKARGE